MPDARLVVRAEQALVDGVLQRAVLEVTGRTITSVLTGAAADTGAAGTDVTGRRRRPARVVDVPAGTYLLPGNVDSHVHVNEPGRTD